MREGLLRLLLAGEEVAVAPVAEVLGEQLPGEPLRVLAVLDVDVDAHARRPLFSAELDEALMLLVSDDGVLTERLAALPARVPGAALGVSSPVPWARLAEGVRQARQAAEHSQAPGGGRVTSFADLAGRGWPRCSTRPPCRPSPTRSWRPWWPPTAPAMAT